MVVCNLASLNLGRLNTEDEEELRLVIEVTVRALDNVIDLNAYPLPQAQHTAKLSREMCIRDRLCYLTYTTPQTHELILTNLKKSSMYSGVVKGVGPRYCPSIEDKLVRFSDKPRHQIFLEPESESLDTTYVQGFSTSLPRDLQEQMVDVYKRQGIRHEL